MGGGGVVRRILSSRTSLTRAAERGFTLIETMIAMSVAITVLLANIYLFNTSQKDFALAKTITEATNLATNRIADFRARVMDASPCFKPGTTTPDPGLVNYGFTGNGSPCTTGDINPDYPGLLNEDFCSPPSSRAPDFPLKAADGPSGTPLCEAPGARNSRFCNPALNPNDCTVIGRTEPPLADQRQKETLAVDGIPFTLAWDVSYVDLDPAASPAADLVGDLVKIKIDVAWMTADKGHHVNMATFTTGRPR